MKTENKSNKLELKHIAPYLPYNLKWIVTCDNLEEDFSECDFPSGTLDKGTIWELFLLTTKDIEFWGGECSDMAFIDSNHNQISYCGGMKPILRPLSDLAREIEINGEKFVPIIELSKINGFNYKFGEITNENDTIVLYSEVDKHPSTQSPFIKHFFEVDLEDCDFDWGFVVFDENDSEEVETVFFPVKNQIELLNKLLEWNFDVFNLIPKGLAISYNEL